MPPRGGVDLGGTKIQTVVVDGRHKVLGESRVPTPTEGGPKDVLDAITGALAAAASQAGFETDSLIGVGVGSPGAIDAGAGTVSQARNLPDWEGSFPLGPELQAALGTRVELGNDVSVATEAEFRLGAGKPFQSILGVFWGTGVDGAQCPCGRKGCMEAYAGRAAMEARARQLQEKGEKTNLFEIMEQRGRTRLTSGIWARALEQDDKMAIELIDRAVEALGAGVASAVNLLDVEAVIIGGGLGLRMGEPYVKRISKAMKPHLFVDEHPPAIELASLGDLGGALGAALLIKSR